MRSYETVFILDPGLDDATWDKEISKIEELIEKHKGKLLQTDRWGMRRLSYSIRKKNEGYYVLIIFEGAVSLIPELERHFKLSENFLRSLIVQRKKVEPAEREPAVTEENKDVIEDKTCEIK